MLQMETECSYETLAPAYHTIQCHRSKDRNMKLHHHGKSKLNAAEFDYKAIIIIIIIIIQKTIKNDTEI